MSPEDKSRLVKVLNLTTSNIDGEALSAMRMGNALLKKYNVDWAGFIEGAADNSSLFGGMFNAADSFKRGQQKGYNEGYVKGQQEGIRIGRQAGYSTGFNAGCDKVKLEYGWFDRIETAVKIFDFLRSLDNEDFDELVDKMVDMYLDNGGMEEDL